MDAIRILDIILGSSECFLMECNLKGRKIFSYCLYLTGKVFHADFLMYI